VGPEEHAHKTPSYDTKMLLKVVFDKTAFVNYKFKNLQKKIREQKVSKHLPNVCVFPKRKPYPWVWIQKSIEYLYGLL
jgi:hypothetical protein